MASVDRLIGESEDVDAGKCGDDSCMGAVGAEVGVGEGVEVGRLIVGKGKVVEVLPAIRLLPTVVMALWREAGAEKLW